MFEGAPLQLCGAKSMLNKASFMQIVVLAGTKQHINLKTSYSTSFEVKSSVNLLCVVKVLKVNANKYYLYKKIKYPEN